MKTSKKFDARDVPLYIIQDIPILKNGNPDEYWGKFHLLSKPGAIMERRELFQIINGNVFFPLKAWL